MKTIRIISMVSFMSGFFFLLTSTIVFAAGGQETSKGIEKAGIVGAAESFVNNGDGTTTFDFYSLSGVDTLASTENEVVTLTLQTVSESKSYKVISMSGDSVTILVDLDADSIVEVADSSVKLVSSEIGSINQVAAR